MGGAREASPICSTSTRALLVGDGGGPFRKVATRLTWAGKPLVENLEKSRAADGTGPPPAGKEPHAHGRRRPENQHVLLFMASHLRN